MDKIIEPSSKPVRIFFFWTGIVATVAYRIIIFLNIYSSLWVDIAWYIGTAGFVLYFWHRYSVAKKRAELVKKYNLLDAVKKCRIEPDKKQALFYLVETSLTSKSRWNSALIFLLSLIALAFGAVLDIYMLFK